MDEASPAQPESNDKLDDWKSWPPEQFLNTLLHELRTPIMIIKGYATILADDKHKDMLPDAIEAISHAANKIDILWNDVADYTRGLMNKS